MDELYRFFPIAALLLMTSCADPTAPADPAFPNIVYVLADDLGYGDIGAFNPNSKIPTPYIDRLAATGLRFTDAHTSSSVCTPTRYGILTGRYNWRTRLKSSVLTGKSKALIPTDRTTVASVLQKQGYHTAFIGKWHLGWDWPLEDPNNFGGSGWNKGDCDNIDFTRPVTHTPNDLGFDYAYGHSGSLDMAPYVYVENGQITALPDTVTVDTGKYTWWREGPTGADFVHEQVTPNFFQRAERYIQERAEQTTPFFLYLALPSPHTPILPTATWQDTSGLNPYADFVMMIDHHIGQLQQVLEDADVDRNTLFIFTSDNGCSPAAKIDELMAKGHHPSYHFRGHKADIYEGGHRVPFIARWPARIEPGTTSDETICTTDLMATCAAIAGYTLADDEGEDSYNLLPLLKGKELTEPLREATVHHSINGSLAIRQGDWKLILCPGSGGWSFPRPNQTAVLDSLPAVQLYNLRENPEETKNVQAAHPEMVTALTALLTQYVRRGRSTPGLAQENDPIAGEWSQIWFAEE